MIENAFLSLTESEFISLFPSFKKYYYSSIYKWIEKGVYSFNDMSDLPQSVRDTLTESFTSVLSSSVIHKSEEKDSIKLLISLYDNSKIECVLLKTENNEITFCLSSQVGCTEKCEFCATGTLPFKRSLYSFEIIEQFLHLKSIFNKVDHIVFMGMGEPLDNFDEVCSAIRVLTEKFNISSRRITISTSGIADKIKALADSEINVKLALSLVTTDEDERKKLMSAARKFTLSELSDALVYYFNKKKRRIALEYCLLSGVNTKDDDVKKLKKFTKGFYSSLNLIPWNEIKELNFKTPTKDEIKKFCYMLEKENIPYTLRVTRGKNTNAACGMLALKN